MKWSHLAAATVMVAGLLIVGGAPPLSVIGGAAMVWLWKGLRRKFA